MINNTTRTFNQKRRQLWLTVKLIRFILATSPLEGTLPVNINILHRCTFQRTYRKSQAYCWFRISCYLHHHVGVYSELVRARDVDGRWLNKKISVSQAQTGRATETSALSLPFPPLPLIAVIGGNSWELTTNFIQEIITTSSQNFRKTEISFSGSLK